ncbi:uncharacterized protein LOC118485900 [Helianthus annuus]|uniref:uncharacterized protein LOC118485900 n=1 Tax=Helianthus annuus TaxID=4232 RepID=UPI001652C820|nr:uncharacterized protein LOC118485900 [Helianthus annuus]
MDEFMNPFSDMFAFTGNTGDDTSNNTNENVSNPSAKKTLSDALSVESAYGTYNKPPKLMVIEEYNRWAKRFEEWLKAFAYPSWKSMKNGFNMGRSDYENIEGTEDVDSFLTEQKCIALLHQSVRDDIISLIEYTNAKDLWKKLRVKCVGSAEINTIKSEDLTVDLLIERVESHELEIKKSYKVNHSSYQENVELYYRGSMIPKNVSPKTAFSAENSNTSNQESSSSGFHSGSLSTTLSQSASKNLFQCNIVVDLKNAQNFSEESAKQQMVFLASVLEYYESLVVTCFRCKQKGHFKRECRNAPADDTANPFREDYYKRANYHQNKSEPPRMKQLEDASKEKSRALAVIHDDEGFDWSELLPEEDVVGYAFVTKIVPFKDNRIEEEKFINRRMKAQNRMSRIYHTFKEAKKAKRWDADRECYLDPKGNIAVDPDSISVDALIQQIAEEEEEEEANQRLWWGGGEADDKEKEMEEEPQLKKVDDGIIDTSQEFTAENLKKMADKVLAAKELEVVSGSGTESKSKVSQNDAINESGKKAKTESDCKNCMKDCKVCSTLAYLSGKMTEELTKRVRDVEDQILNRDKMLKASNERSEELTEKIEKDKNDVERIQKENEKLIHENRQLSENFEKLKRTVKVSDERNSKTTKENLQLSGLPRDVQKKDQPSGKPLKDEFFLYKEVEVGSEESLKMNDKNFPPLFTKTTHINVKLPESKEAWVASKSN